MSELLWVGAYIVAGFLVLLLEHHTAGFDPYYAGDWYFCWSLWPLVLLGVLIVYATRIRRAPPPRKAPPMLSSKSREKLLAKLKAETAWARRCTPEQARARLIELGHLDAEGRSVYTDGETDAE